jgi:hypothetical protein
LPAASNKASDSVEVNERPSAASSMLSRSSPCPAGFQPPPAATAGQSVGGCVVKNR